MRQILTMKLQDLSSERDFLKDSLAALKEARLLDEEGFDVERARYEREVEEARERVEVKEVVIEKVVEVEVEGAREGAEAAIVQALKEELRDRDVEVQKLRKKVKGVERELDARRERVHNDENAVGGAGGEAAAAWTKLKPSDRRAGEDNPWEAARRRGRGGGSTVIDSNLDNIERAERLERAFGQISMKLQQN